MKKFELFDSMLPVSMLILAPGTAFDRGIGDKFAELMPFDPPEDIFEGLGSINRLEYWLDTNLFKLLKLYKLFMLSFILLLLDKNSKLLAFKLKNPFL